LSAPLVSPLVGSAPGALWNATHSLIASSVVTAICGLLWRWPGF
jgi:hypothetical protein